MTRRNVLQLSFAAIGGSLLLVLAGFGVDNYLLQVGTTLAMYLVLCVSWNIVGGYMGYASFATATFFGLGVYVDALVQIAGVPAPFAWLISSLAGAAFAALLGSALLRLRGHYFAIGTIVTVQVMREIANNWDSVTGGAIGLNLPLFPGSAEFVTRFFFFVMWGLAALAIIVTLLLDRSRFGVALRCIKQNESAASMIGVNVFASKVNAFVLSGALSAAAGAIYASMVTFVEPNDAFNILMTISVPVVVMLGGMGTILGPLVGSILYVGLSEIVWVHFLNWHTAILGLIIMFVIYVMPRGVLGLRWRGEVRRAAAALPLLRRSVRGAAE